MPKYKTHADISIVHRADSDDEAEGQMNEIIGRIVGSVEGLAITEESSLGASIQRVPDSPVPLTLQDLDDIQ